MVDRDLVMGAVDEIDDLFYVLSPAGDLRYWNDRVNEVTGYTDDEIADMMPTDFFHEADREAVGRAVYQVVEHHERRTVEARLHTNDGEVIPYELSGAPLFEDEEFRGLVGVGRDVTHRREREAELERVNEELETLNRVVRHDIRNDMDVVLGWAGALEDHVDDTGREYLERILSTGHHVVELTAHARDYVEAIAGEGDADLEPIAPGYVLEEVIERQQSIHDHATIRPPEDPPATPVMADEMLDSVFRNVLTNAVLHSDRESPTVETSVRERDDRVVVEVADDGPGVPDDRKKTVFGKGEKGIDSKGTGIGLYLVNTLVEEYGGEVWVKDNEPRGAVVVMEFPAAGVR